MIGSARNGNQDLVLSLSTKAKKNAAKYADEVIVLSKGVQDYFKETYVDDTNRPKKTSDVIAGSNNEDSTLTEGTINYDVRFDAIAPASEGSATQKDVIRLIINVEAQTAFLIRDTR